MLRLVCVSLILVWLALSGGAAFAQGHTPDLTVTLHNIDNAPLAGVTVIVRDGSGTHDLAQAATDAQGVASFSGMTESQVRIAIVGALPNGTRLYQVGNDASGISLLLDPPPTRLDLRSESNGMVVPDPATMAALEPGVPVATSGAVIPTAPIASRIPLAQTAPPLSAPPPAAAPPATAVAPAALADADAPESRSEQLWFGLLLLALLLGAGIGIVVVQRRAV